MGREGRGGEVQEEDRAVVSYYFAFQLAEFGNHGDDVVHFRQEPGINASQLTQLP